VKTTKQQKFKKRGEKREGDFLSLEKLRRHHMDMSNVCGLDRTFDSHHFNLSTRHIGIPPLRHRHPLLPQRTARTPHTTHNRAYHTSHQKHNRTKRIHPSFGSTAHVITAHLLVVDHTPRTDSLHRAVMRTCFGYQAIEFAVENACAIVADARASG